MGKKMQTFSQWLDAIFQLPVAVFKLVVMLTCFVLLLVPVMAVAIIQGRQSWKAWGLWFADRLSVIRNA